MGVRNVTRRKTQTVLIVIGLMLSTLIISAAFATGDTVGYSVTNTVYNEFGEADILIVLDSEAAPVGVDDLTDEDVATIAALLADDPDVDAVTGVVQTTVPALNPAARLSEPQALFVGVDPATVDDLHGLVTTDGAVLSAASLGAGQAYVSRDLAEAVDAAAGSEITIYYAEQPYTFQILEIVEDNALSSQTGGGAAGGGGVVVSLETLRSITNEATLNLIVISATGGVRDTLDIIPDLRTRLEADFAAQDLPLEVATDKEEVVGFAELIGSFFVTFFLVFGLFSIAAGVMLIFLTFIMLAAERRAEMGIARAVGMKRLHLTESFIAEGMTYNIGSALVGALLGLAVAYGLITFLGSVADDFGLAIGFHVSPVGFLISYCLGVVLTFVTVAFSSWRAANLNIVRAIRDIPEPEPLKGRDTSFGGLFKATVGAAWYMVWILMLTLAVIVLIPVVGFSIASYGVPLIGVALVVAFYIWGIGLLGSRPRGIRLVALVAWWIVFNVVGLITLFLLKTKGWADYHRNSGGWAVVMIMLGLILTWWGGWVSGQAFAYTAGTTLVLFATAMLAVYFGAPAKPAFATIAAVTLWYWMLPLPFSLIWDGGKGWTDPLDGLFGLVGLGHDPIIGNIEMFFVSGVCITAASTLFVIFNADRLLGSLNLLQAVFGGLTPAVRTAISYPLASKLRTGMTLAMFTLVMFSLVVMATLNYNFTQLFLGETAKGGFDIVVEENPNNRFPDLRAVLDESNFDQAQIEAVGSLVIANAEFRPVNEPEDELQPYRLAGLDDTFLAEAAFPLATRAIGYETDEAVMAALAADPTLVLANEGILTYTQEANFDTSEQLSIEGAISDLQETPWEPMPLILHNPDTGEEREVRIIGFVDSPIAFGVVPEWLSIFSGQELVTEVFGDGDNGYFFVKTGNPEPVSIANVIEASLLERGVQAESLQQRIDDSAAQSNAFSLLFQMFMGLGLIVGIAALGVIAFRTVSERRQQIGMLRAIGYTRKLVAISFFLESSFIALTGIGMGLVLGAALAYNLFTSPDFTNGQEVDFAIPWVRLLIIMGVAYLASAIMTLIPARSAARVSVAEALRYSG